MATETLTRESSAGSRMDVTQETRRTGVSESRGEAATLKTDIRQPKTTRRVGCWNVRTLYQTGKLAQFVMEINSYKIELFCVSEKRWTGSGQMQ